MSFKANTFAKKLALSELCTLLSTSRGDLHIFAVLALLLVLSGCHLQTRPDLARLYETRQLTADQPPVILIPGIMGSRLAREDGKEIWVGSTAKLLTSSFPELALPVNGAARQEEYPVLHPTRLTDKLAGKDFYASIVQVLESAGHYRPGKLGSPPPAGQRQYYEFAYDWRQDNVVTAKNLSKLIDQIRVDYHNPDLQVDIIAHSMGGLVTRYYLRYGSDDVLDTNAFTPNYTGAGRVRRVALLGTPNLGSAGPLHAFITGLRLGLGSVEPEVLATFPSVYELFPHPLNTWVIDIHGEPIESDLFDVQTWQQYRWSIFDPKVKARILSRHSDPMKGAAYYKALQEDFAYRLERARRFVWSLTIPLEKTPWDIRVFGGDCTLTPARILLEEVDGQSLTRLWPREVARPVAGVSYEKLMLEPGDGSVTKASLLARDSLDPGIPRHRYSYFPVSGEMFLCEQHDQLSTNITFQDNLLQYLLSRDAIPNPSLIK